METEPLPHESIERPLTVVENILAGNADIKFISESPDEKVIFGRKWQGNSYGYDLDVPGLVNPNERWKTVLTVWLPAAYEQREHQYMAKPEMQITILTGQGEMQLTKDKARVLEIFKQIQTQTAR